MRNLFIYLFSFLIIFQGCEDDEIFDLNEQVNVLNATVEQNKADSEAADAAIQAASEAGDLAIVTALDAAIAAQAEMNAALEQAIEDEAAARAEADAAERVERIADIAELRIEIMEAKADVIEMLQDEVADLASDLQAVDKARADGDSALETLLKQEADKRAAEIKEAIAGLKADLEREVATLEARLAAIEEGDADIEAQLNAAQAALAALNNDEAVEAVAANDLDALVEYSESFFGELVNYVAASDDNNIIFNGEVVANNATLYLNATDNGYEFTTESVAISLYPDDVVYLYDSSKTAVASWTISALDADLFFETIYSINGDIVYSASIADNRHESGTERVVTLSLDLTQAAHKGIAVVEVVPAKKVEVSQSFKIGDKVLDDKAEFVINGNNTTFTSGTINLPAGYEFNGSVNLFSTTPIDEDWYVVTNGIIEAGATSFKLDFVFKDDDTAKRDAYLDANDQKEIELPEFDLSDYVEIQEVKMSYNLKFSATASLTVEFSSRELKAIDLTDQITALGLQGKSTNANTNVNLYTLTLDGYSIFYNRATDVIELLTVSNSFDHSGPDIYQDSTDADKLDMSEYYEVIPLDPKDVEMTIDWGNGQGTSTVSWTVNQDAIVFTANVSLPSGYEIDIDNASEVLTFKEEVGKYTIADNNIKSGDTGLQIKLIFDTTGTRNAFLDGEYDINIPDKDISDKIEYQEVKMSYNFKFSATASLTVEFSSQELKDIDLTDQIAALGLQGKSSNFNGSISLYSLGTDGYSIVYNRATDVISLVQIADSFDHGGSDIYEDSTDNSKLDMSDYYESIPCFDAEASDIDTSASVKYSGTSLSVTAGTDTYTADYYIIGGLSTTVTDYSNATATYRYKKGGGSFSSGEAIDTSKTLVIFWNSDPSDTSASFRAALITALNAAHSGLNLTDATMQLETTDNTGKTGFALGTSVSVSGCDTTVEDYGYDTGGTSFSDL